MVLSLEQKSEWLVTQSKDTERGKKYKRNMARYGNSYLGDVRCPINIVYTFPLPLAFHALSSFPRHCSKEMDQM